MSQMEGIWSSKSDDEVLEAARDLPNYTAEAESIIRAELRRRSLEEPPPFERPPEEQREREAAPRSYGAAAVLLLTALFIAPFPLLSLVATPAAIVAAVLAATGKTHAAKTLALWLMIGIVAVSVPMLASTYGNAPDRAAMGGARWLGVFIGGGPMAALAAGVAHSLLRHTLLAESRKRSART